jgi:ADP-ribose pyrophosphatase YjhB (NUDIX family)
VALAGLQLGMCRLGMHRTVNDGRGNVSNDWLDWVRRLKAIAQNGAAYSRDPYDKERFGQVGAIAVEILAARTGRPVDEVLAALAYDAGPATPKLDVRAAVIHEGKILLVREASDGLWTLPGGWIDVQESAARAATREVKEESGYDCEPIKLYALLDSNRHPHPPRVYHVHKAFFLCRLSGGSPRPSLETTEVTFFAEDELPRLSTARVTPSQIALAFQHFREPTLPTAFD